VPDVSNPNANKRRVVSNLIIMSSGTVATWLVSTVYLVLMSRYLGATLQGEFSRASYAVLLLGLVISLGIDTYITRTVARSPERAPALIGAALILRAALTLPLLAAFILYLRFVPHVPAESRAIGYILFAGMVVGALGSPLMAAFQAREQMSLGVISAVVQNLLELALVGAIIVLHGGLVAFAVASVMMSVIQLGLALYWARRSIHVTLRVALADVREVAAGGLAFWVGGFVVTFYTYIDSVILGSLAGDKPVGLYAAALRLLGVPFFLPGIIGAATLPLLSRLGVGVQADFARVSRKTLALLLLCIVPLTIATATFAEPLILTIYGRAYAGAAPVLVVLALLIPPTFLNIQFYQMLVARNQQWRWTVIMVVGCIANPLLNLALIPYAARQWHNAALGAACSLVATEVVMVVYGVVLLRDIVLHRPLGRVLAGALTGGAAQGIVLWLTEALWPPLGQALGLAAFGVVAVALGALPREDVGYLWDTLRGQLRDARARLQPRRTVALTPPDGG